PDKGSRGDEGSRERAPRRVRTALTRARPRPCGGTPQLPPARVAEDAGAEAAPPPARAPQPPASARNRRRPPPDLLGRQVLLVGRDRPHVPEGIHDLPVAVAPERVLERHADLRAGRDRAREG